jgi:predicted acyl esterase
LVKPPHLEAICVWEGAGDSYREASHHGGIHCTFLENWFPRQIVSVQHGLGARGPMSSLDGRPVCGEEELTDEQLAGNRENWRRLHLNLDDKTLSFDAPAAESTATYAAFGEGLTLFTAPFSEETEITGPAAARLWVSSSTTDADLFLVLRLFDPDGNEVLFHFPASSA